MRKDDVVKNVLNVNYEAINNFISNNFEIIDDFDYAIESIYKLDEFLSKNMIEISYDVINLLIQNEKVKNMINVIISKYLPVINMDIIEKKYANYLLTSIIETYAIYNNIDLMEDENSIKYNSPNGSISGLTTYFRDLAGIRRLTIEEEKMILDRIKNGDIEARNIFIESNLKLVISIANKYRSNVLTFQDLIQEGNIGLMEAIIRYNPDLGFRFSTYASHWIRRSINQAIKSQTRAVYIPDYMHDYMKKINHIKEELYKKKGREATIDEISEILNVENRIVDRCEQLMEAHVSLNSPVNEDDELGEITAVSSETVEDIAMDNFLSSELMSAMDIAKLSNREKEILKCRFGFYSCGPLSQAEIAKLYNISRQRIQQIILGAIEKIRLNTNSMCSLEQYINSDKFNQNQINNKSKKNSNKKNIVKKAYKISSIYDFFKGYPKYAVDDAIELLNEHEKALITLMCLDNYEVNKSERQIFYEVILPKIKEYLLKQESYFEEDHKILIKK